MIGNQAQASPIAPDADLALRRILTSGRAVSRLRALTDGLWDEGPGEALTSAGPLPSSSSRRCGCIVTKAASVPRA